LNLERALEALAAGGFVALVDAPDREDEADVLLAARHATGERVNFLATHARGLIAVVLPERRLRALEVPLIEPCFVPEHYPRFGVPVDAAHGITTGASAFDRALTLRLLADPASRAEDFSRPGHMLPLAAVEGGLGERRGHTEGAAALAELAGLEPVVAICELMAPDGTMAAGRQVSDFADQHGMPLISVQQLVERLAGKHG
jgi:3,4-dihydroxy-2-butanone 4-phosphate synthase